MINQIATTATELTEEELTLVSGGAIDAFTAVTDW
jgi:bacteriocin-like protein